MLTCIFNVHMHVDMHIVMCIECTRVYIVIVILTQITPHNPLYIHEYSTQQATIVWKNKETKNLAWEVNQKRNRVKI